MIRRVADRPLLFPESLRNCYLCGNYYTIMPQSHTMLLPYGRRTALRSTVCKMWFLKIVRSCGIWQLWSQMLRRPHGDRTIHEIKNRKVTARPTYGDRTTQLPQICRTAAVREPWGRREAAVRISRHPGPGKKRISPSQSYRSATVRWPCGVVAALLHYRFRKRLHVKLKKN